MNSERRKRIKAEEKLDALLFKNNTSNATTQTDNSADVALQNTKNETVKDGAQGIESSDSATQTAFDMTSQMASGMWGVEDAIIMTPDGPHHISYLRRLPDVEIDKSDV